MLNLYSAIKKSIYIFFGIFCINIIVCCAAQAHNYKQILRHVENTPRERENKVRSLVKYLTHPFDDDYSKAMAIAFWIAGHINYDSYLYNNNKTTKLLNKYKGQTADELLKSRVGICSDFAELFQVMCDEAGIKSHKVSGWVYPNNTNIRSSQKSNYGHAWNFFVYQKQKIYVDTTFMAEGSIQPRGRINDLGHRRALKKVRKLNKRKSRITNFDIFYFDFKYNDEERKKGYIREEK